MKYLVITGILLLMLGILVVPIVDAKTDYDCAGSPIYINNTVINDWIDVRLCNGGLIENVTVYRLELDGSNNIVLRNVTIQSLGVSSIGSCAYMFLEDGGSNNSYYNVHILRPNDREGSRITRSNYFYDSDIGWMDGWNGVGTNYLINTSHLNNNTCNSAVNGMQLYNQYYVDYTVDDGSDPLENVNVTVYNSTGGVEAVGYTDSNGQLRLISTDWYCKECHDGNPVDENVSADGDPHTVFFTLDGYYIANDTYTLGGDAWSDDGDNAVVTASLTEIPAEPPEPPSLDTITAQVTATVLNTAKLLFGIGILLAVAVGFVLKQKNMSQQALLTLFGIIIIGVVLLGILLAI